jgi:hypothetical protein
MSYRVTIINTYWAFMKEAESEVLKIEGSELLCTNSTALVSVRFVNVVKECIVTYFQKGVSRKVQYTSGHCIGSLWLLQASLTSLTVKLKYQTRISIFSVRKINWMWGFIVHKISCHMNFMYCNKSLHKSRLCEPRKKKKRVTLTA